MSEPIERIRTVLKQEGSALAFVFGNGINRYADNVNGSSWKDMLLEIYHQFTGKRLDTISEGISYTEFYNILSLENGNVDTLRNAVVDYTREHYTPKDYHRWLQVKLAYYNVPVLTTNFDTNLDDGYSRRKLIKLEGKRHGFTDLYPWNVYYGPNILHTPLDGFAIWHINGVIDYRRSIKLGLSDYINQTARARNFIHSNDKIMEFDRKNRPHWNGSNTWLHIIFNSSLCFIGLELDTNETFLRWMLLERARYFKNFSKRRHRGWYVTTKEVPAGKRFFLESTDIEIVTLKNYDEVYQGIFE